MAIRINFDPSGNPELPTLVLANRNGSKIGNITNKTNVNFKGSLVNADEFTFTAHKRLGNNYLKYWNELTNFKLIWIPEWDKWFQLSVEVDQDDETIKNVNVVGLGESELSQIMLYNVEINTEADIAREDYVIPTTFYNPDNKEASLVDRLLEKAPHYSLKHIDISLMNIQRTYTFDEISIYDAFQEIAEEVHCLFVFDCNSNPDGTINRSISIYDLESNCLDCGYRGIFTEKCPKCESTNITEGYGEDTTIFISKENLAEEINYSTDVDSIKNCFYLEAGDDLMTAAVRACNPNGTNYLWYFSDEMKNNMSEELRNKINEYDESYSYYQTTYPISLSSTHVDKYNSLISKYSKYDESLLPISTPIIGYPNLMKVYFDTIDFALLLKSKLMPNIERPELTAENQANMLLEALTTLSTISTQNLSSSTADNIVLSFANAIIYPAYKTQLEETSLSGTTWTGRFKITSYSDEEDTYTTSKVSVLINDDYENYIKQRLDKILYKEDSNIYDIVGLFSLELSVFKSELKKYCLDNLNIFHKCCQSCLDIMIQQGISEKNTENPSTYNELYIPYYNKLNAIQDEINVRDSEIEIIEGKYNSSGKLIEEGLQTEIDKVRDDIQSKLNFESYLGTELWIEFCSFKREDKYRNPNYISDGLNNTELFNNALEFINVANKEIYKSANYQHSISTTLKNLLIIKEFKPLVSMFEVGNWLRVEIDNEIYKLRLVDYEIDFENTQNISVTFSDIEKTVDGNSDIQDLLNRTNTMLTSYDALVKQSEINSDTTRDFNNMILNGLSVTNTKIVSNAENQDIMWDEHGLLCREYNDILGDYNPRQLKIINDGMYITDDYWKTTRAAVGRFIYFDPKDSIYKEGYGVIADTLCSNLILSNEVGVYNEEKSIELSKNGIIVTTNTYSKNVFTIQREIIDEEENVTYEKQLYIDDNGNIVLSGGASISWDNITGTENIATNESVSQQLSEFEKLFSDNFELLQKQIDGQIESWFFDYEPTNENLPASEWITDEDKNKHLGDLFYIVDNPDMNGMGYRYALVNDEYRWEMIEDTQTLKALADAAKALETANVKKRVFSTTPYPPYDIDDLWVQGKNGDIMVCVVSRTTGSYVESDWIKASKYTDDSALNAFINGEFKETIDSIIQQSDGKADTWYQSNDPSIDWETEDEKKEHIGDIWFNTTSGQENTYMWDGTSWQEMKTNPPQEIFDRIDGKAQIFIKTPTVPYNIGDLWFDSSTSDIMTCINPKESGEFDLSDWEKRNKYTDDTKANEVAGNLADLSDDYDKLKQILGYNGTTITGTYIYSPNIIGGQISIGSAASGVQAQITSDGKLTATGVDISGVIKADSGEIGGFTIASDSLYSGSGVFGGSGVYVSPNGISCGSIFKVTSSGVLTATDVNLTGVINATSGNFNGDINAENIKANEEYRIYFENADYTSSIIRTDDWDLSNNYARRTVYFGLLDELTGTDDYTRVNCTRQNTSALTNQVRLETSISGKEAYVQVYSSDIYGSKVALYADNIDVGSIYTDKVNILSSNSTCIANSDFGITLKTTSDGGYCIFPSDINGNEASGSIPINDGIIKLGTSNHKFLQVYAKNLYASESITLGNTTITSWSQISGGTGGTSDYNDLTNRPRINGVILSGNKTSSALGLASSSHTHTPQDVNWGVANSGNLTSYYGYGHIHSIIINKNHNMTVAITNDATPAFCPYRVTSYTDPDDLSLTQGGTCNLGASNTPFNIGYFNNLYIGSQTLAQYIQSNSSGGTSDYNDLSNKPRINSTTLSGNISLDTLGIGTRLNLYGTTLYLEKTNGNTIDYVDLSSLSGGGSSTPSEVIASDGVTRPPITTGTGSTQKVAYITANNTSSLNVRAQFGSYSYSTMYVTLSSSDKRLKTNFKDTSIKALNILEQVKMKEFDWINTYKHQKIGIIADELELLDKDFVLGGGYDENGEMIVKSINNFYLQMYEIKAIQELSEMNKSLKSEILLLQGELALLKQKMEEMNYA